MLKKLQDPSTKLQRNIKHQKRGALFRNLVFGTSLELGCWCLELFYADEFA
jgi:hypothetical protein